MEISEACLGDVVEVWVQSQGPGKGLVSYLRHPADVVVAATIIGRGSTGNVVLGWKDTDYGIISANARSGVMSTVSYIPNEREYHYSYTVSGSLPIVRVIGGRAETPTLPSIQVAVQTCKCGWSTPYPIPVQGAYVCKSCRMWSDAAG